MLVVGVGILLIDDCVMLVVRIGILQAYLKTFGVFRVLSDLCKLFESCVTTGSSDFCKSSDLLFDFLLWIDCAMLNKVKIELSDTFKSQGIDFSIIDKWI